MPIVDDILETLDQAARKISTGKTPRSVVESYDVVTALIQDILSRVGSKDVIKVFVTRREDPAIWGEPVIGVALSTLGAERIDEIHAATYILASRLPGKTKIPRPKRKIVVQGTSFRLAGTTKIGRPRGKQAIGDAFEEAQASGEGEEESA